MGLEVVDLWPARFDLVPVLALGIAARVGLSERQEGNWAMDFEGMDSKYHCIVLEVETAVPG